MSLLSGRRLGKEFLGLKGSGNQKGLVLLVVYYYYYTVTVLQVYGTPTQILGRLYSR